MAIGETIRWGILSTGNIAQQFTQDLALVEDAEVLAVGSRSQESADAFAKEHSIPRAYSSYQALVDDPDVDVVYIGTPHVFHKENMLMCLHAGKHVLCEKPFTINTQEADECIALAREKNLFLMEAVWTQFIPAIIKIQDALNNDIIGKQLSVQANFSFHMPFDPAHRLFNKALGGGALLDVGVYTLTIATMILGMPDDIASQALMGESGVDEQVSMLLKYENGASALLHAGINGEMTNQAVIKGTTGTLTIHDPFWHPTRYTVKKYGTDAEETIEIPHEGFGYAYEARAVHTQLRAGAIEHPAMSHATTRQMMQLCDDLRESWGLVYPQETT